jgi:hypothetical protein
MLFQPVEVFCDVGVTSANRCTGLRNRYTADRVCGLWKVINQSVSKLQSTN